MYQVNILDEAKEELADLDKPIATRIVKRVGWLAENFDHIRPESLYEDGESKRKCAILRQVFRFFKANSGLFVDKKRKTGPKGRVCSRLSRFRIGSEPLSSNLAGLYKLRVGDYRVVYEVFAEEHYLVIHKIGHRREVYR